MLAGNDDGNANPLPGSLTFTSLEPDYLNVLRIHGAIQSAVLFFMVLATISAINSEYERAVPYWAFVVPLAIFAVWLIWISPKRRFEAWGYRLEQDELRIKRGVWTRQETTVPLGRVQHIDVGQRAIERACGVSYLALHTAGMAYNVVKLPGLTREAAEGLRDEIRIHIRADLG